jgi:dienelactone hydrolase
LVLVALATPIAANGPALPVFPRPGPPGTRILPETVALQTTDGQALQAAFYKPVFERGSPDTSAPGVLLVHDAGGSRAQLDPLGERMSRQGYGVLTLDLRGHGASRSPKLDWDKLSESDKKSTWALATKDIDAAAHWLLDQPGINSTSLALVGYGAGCSLAVRHAMGDEAVICMVLLAPNPADYGLDVRSDLQTLAGLATFVATAKDAEAEKMALEANASSGNPYLDIFLSPPKLATPLDDKNLPGKVLKWVGDKAMPKKGR